MRLNQLKSGSARKAAFVCIRNPQILIKWTARVASDVKEATALIEAGFEYVTGDYSDGGKIFRKRK